MAYTLDWLMFFSDKSKQLTLGVVTVLGVVVGSAACALATSQVTTDTPRALLVALDPAQQAIDKPFMQAKAVTARFYADHILVKVPGLRDSIVQGADSVIDMALEAD